ncbi:MAG TPA: uroporphyrinogen decarboxylase [Papillibacter sp.]|jgi:hypothetical protein|nr:uroporphyrinogen decarboxylase [Papillibacter sp.]
MLTKRENLIETLRGGKPDRYVNQFEALEFIFATPYNRKGRPTMPGQETVNQWGVTIRWQEGTPGPFPVHDDEHIVLKDVTEWRTQVKIPSLDFPQEEWDVCKEMASKLDRKEKLATALLAPGVFDQLHYLMGMEGCLVSFYTEPDALKELIGAITDWELEYARLICDNFAPDAVFHHDDWGSHNSTFISPEMFREFIKPAYEKIYGYYRSRGVQYVFHHSDSFAATLVPDMIDMGIDVWQGCVDTNDIPALIKQYGGKISFMGGINNGKADVPNWTPEMLAKYVEDTCRACGTKYYIPCLTAGGPKSNYDGVYETVSKEIDRMSRELF